MLSISSFSQLTPEQYFPTGVRELFKTESDFVEYIVYS